LTPSANAEIGVSDSARTSVRSSAGKNLFFAILFHPPVSIFHVFTSFLRFLLYHGGRGRETRLPAAAIAGFGNFLASLFCHMGVYYTQLSPQEVRHALL